MTTGPLASFHLPAMPSGAIHSPASLLPLRGQGWRVSGEWLAVDNEILSDLASGLNYRFGR